MTSRVVVPDRFDCNAFDIIHIVFVTSLNGTVCKSLHLAVCVWGGGAVDIENFQIHSIFHTICMGKMQHDVYSISHLCGIGQKEWKKTTAASKGPRYPPPFGFLLCKAFSGLILIVLTEAVHVDIHFTFYSNDIV